MVAVLLALLSSICWGTADFAGGAASRRIAVTTVVLLSQASGGALLVVVCLVAREPFPHGFWLGMTAGLLGVVGLLLFYAGLAMGKMSLVAAVAGCGAALPVAFSLLTGHVPRPVTLAGLGLAMAGIVLSSLTAGDATPGGTASNPAPPRPRAAAMAAVGAAICFGLFLLILGQVSRAEPASVLWVSLSTRAASVPSLSLFLLLSRRGLPRGGLDRATLGVIALVGVGDVSANTLFAIANTLGGLAETAVLGSLYPVVTALLARIRLGELLSNRQKAGAALAMLGVVLVSIP